MRVISANALLLCVILLMSSFQLNSYSASKKNFQFEYYIFISGVNERTDVLNLQESIQKKQGVTYFMAERFPVRCFVLRASRSISESEFKQWLPKNFTVLCYGEGNKAKENAYLIYNQEKKIKH